MKLGNTHPLVLVNNGRIVAQIGDGTRPETTANFSARTASVQTFLVPILASPFPVTSRTGIHPPLGCSHIKSTKTSQVLHTNQNTINHLNIATNRFLNSSFHIRHASTP
ncbi:hypothetical protein CUC08_Gglean002425 [Alternaria sp. MG1]|nr:hypothetical protein CUC08_Gglean002425 [Alternaria sp. MG1]